MVRLWRGSLEFDVLENPAGGDCLVWAAYQLVTNNRDVVRDDNERRRILSVFRNYLADEMTKDVFGSFMDISEQERHQHVVRLYRDGFEGLKGKYYWNHVFSFARQASETTYDFVKRQIELVRTHGQPLEACILDYMDCYSDRNVTFHVVRATASGECVPHNPDCPTYGGGPGAIEDALHILHEVSGDSGHFRAMVRASNTVGRPAPIHASRGTFAPLRAVADTFQTAWLLPIEALVRNVYEVLLRTDRDPVSSGARCTCREKVCDDPNCPVSIHPVFGFAEDVDVRDMRLLAALTQSYKSGHIIHHIFTEYVRHGSLGIVVTRNNKPETARFSGAVDTFNDLLKTIEGNEDGAIRMAFYDDVQQWQTNLKKRTPEIPVLAVISHPKNLTKLADTLNNLATADVLARGSASPVGMLPIAMVHDEADELVVDGGRRRIVLEKHPIEIPQGPLDEIESDGDDDGSNGSVERSLGYFRCKTQAERDEFRRVHRLYARRKQFTTLAVGAHSVLQVTSTPISVATSDLLRQRAPDGSTGSYVTYVAQSGSNYSGYEYSDVDLAEDRKIRYGDARTMTYVSLAMFDDAGPRHGVGISSGTTKKGHQLLRAKKLQEVANRADNPHGKTLASISWNGDGADVFFAGSRGADLFGAFGELDFHIKSEFGVTSVAFEDECRVQLKGDIDITKVLHCIDVARSHAGFPNRPDTFVVVGKMGERAVTFKSLGHEYNPTDLFLKCDEKRPWHMDYAIQALGRLCGISRDAVGKTLWCPPRLRKLFVRYLSINDGVYRSLSAGNNVLDMFEQAADDVTRAAQGGPAHGGLSSAVAGVTLLDGKRSKRVRDVATPGKLTRASANKPIDRERSKHTGRPTTAVDKSAIAASRIMGEVFPVPQAQSRREDPRDEVDEESTRAAKKHKTPTIEDQMRAWATQNHEAIRAPALRILKPGVPMLVDEFADRLFGAERPPDLGIPQFKKNNARTRGGADVLRFMGMDKTGGPWDAWLGKSKDESTKRVYYSRGKFALVPLPSSGPTIRTTRTVTEIIEIIKEAKGEGTFTKEYVRNLFKQYKNRSFHWANLTVTKPHKVGRGGNSYGSGRGAPIVATGTSDQLAPLFRLRRTGDRL